MSWTQEQKSVIKCTDPLIVVNACAGSGKTATLLGVMRANPNKKILYIVFNTIYKRIDYYKILTPKTFCFIIK